MDMINFWPDFIYTNNILIFNISESSVSFSILNSIQYLSKKEIRKGRNSKKSVFGFRAEVVLLLPFRLLNVYNNPQSGYILII